MMNTHDAMKKQFASILKSEFDEWLKEYIVDEFEGAIEDNETIWDNIRNTSFESFIDTDAIWDKALSIVYPSFGVKEAYKLGQLDYKIGGRDDNPFDAMYQRNDYDAWQAGYEGLKPVPKSNTEIPKEWKVTIKKDDVT